MYLVFCGMLIHSLEEVINTKLLSTLVLLSVKIGDTDVTPAWLTPMKYYLYAGKDKVMD